MSHIVVSREHFHLGLAAIDNIDHVLNSDAGLGNVGADNKKNKKY